MPELGFEVIAPDGAIPCIFSPQHFILVHSYLTRLSNVTSQVSIRRLHPHLPFS